MSFEFQARARVQNKSGIIALKNALYFVFPIPNWEVKVKRQSEYSDVYSINCLGNNRPIDRYIEGRN